MKRLLATLVVLACLSVPATASAHTMSCHDIGKYYTKNVAWKGCKGVGGAWLKLIVLGRSGRVYVYLVHHYDTNCGIFGCHRHYVVRRIA